MNTKALVEQADPSEGVPTGIAPLERLKPPSEDMDGRHGAKRMCGPSKIPAETDIDAVLYWIDDSPGTDSAMRQRRQMADKLLNWAYFERGKALSSFEREDFAAFCEFIAHPSPASKWIAGSSTRRSSPTWRPFTGPLTDTSQSVYRSYLTNLLKYLRLNGYADLQFVDDRRSAKRGLADSTFAWQREVGARTTEVLSDREWFWISEALQKPNGVPGVSRERLVVELLYYGHMTITETAALTKEFLWTPAQTGGAFWIAYRQREGEGIGRAEEVLEELDATLSRWFESTPASTAAFNRGAPLVGLCIDELHELVRKVLLEAAQRAEGQGDGQSASSLLCRTPRSFRHARESHERTWPLEVVEAMRPRQALSGRELKGAPGRIRRAQRATLRYVQHNCRQVRCGTSG